MVKKVIVLGLFLWGCACLCGVGYYTSLFYAQPSNPYREEYWEGVGLFWAAGIPSWLGLPLLASFSAKNFGKRILITMHIPVAIALAYFIWYWFPVFIPPLKGVFGR